MTATDRIDERLSSARSAGRCALLPYFTSGFTDQATTAELIVAADAVGASVIELGMPFSDSIADGPVIQSSFNYALARGHRVEDVFDVVREVRPSVGYALTAMLSYSIVHRVARIIQCDALNRWAIFAPYLRHERVFLTRESLPHRKNVGNSKTSSPW